MTDPLDDDPEPETMAFSTEQWHAFLDALELPRDQVVRLEADMELGLLRVRLVDGSAVSIRIGEPEDLN